jgi:hypothetical protein
MQLWNGVQNLFAVAVAATSPPVAVMGEAVVGGRGFLGGRWKEEVLLTTINAAASWHVCNTTR